MALLEAYGDAWNQAMREVYQRCVVGKEAWFVPAKGNGGAPGGVRSELLGRGWSQREATSIHTSAVGAHAAAVESTKLALQRAAQDLEVVEDKLAVARRRTKDKHKRHGLSRAQMRLRSKIARLSDRLDDGDVRVCFGGRKLAMAGNDPEGRGFESRQAWRETWERARAWNFACYGDKEAVFGNYSAQVLLSEDGCSDAVRLRVPVFLRHLSGGVEWAEIGVRGFAERNRRAMLARAMDLDLEGHRRRVVERQADRDLYQVQTAALEAGQAVPVPRRPAVTDPKLACHSPVTVRFFWSEAHSGWYVNATFDRPARKTRDPRPSFVLGADLNPDHIAWCLVNAHGNPLRWGRINIDLSGNADQNRDNLGVATADLCKLARSHGAAIAVETLDFTRARAGLRYSSRRLKRLLPSFAYNKFFQILASRSAAEGLDVIPVNPAWSSVLGQADYAGPYGVSVDQAAARVLARSGLGLGTTVRPQVSGQLPRSGAGAGASPAGTTPSGVVGWPGLKLLAGSLPHRRSTWDPSGFCLRRQSAQAGPPGKGTPPAAPAPCSQPGPKPGTSVSCPKPVPRPQPLRGTPYR